MYAFRTLYRLAVAKKVKINYFVVDARTGRGIDRSLDRIKSRATRLPFPRVFLLFFSFFFLSLLPPFFFSHFSYRDRYERASVLFSFFLNTFDDTQRKMITLFVVAKERGRGGLAISIGGQSSSFDASPWKRDLSRRRRRFEDSRVK